MNEPTITLTGNLTADPELRYIGNGTPVADFTVASTPRTLNKQTNQWDEGEAMFFRCSVWRDHAENVTESLAKGMRVIVTGKLTQRSYQRKDGTPGVSLEIAVDEVAPSLRHATASVQRATAPNRPLDGSQKPEQAFDATHAPSHTSNRSTGRTRNQPTYQAPQGGSQQDFWATRPENDHPPF